MRTSRRNLLLGSLGAVVVGGFDPVRREWLSKARADAGFGARVPRLDGELVFDSAALEEGASDFGGIVHHTPWAVLRPASTRDIVSMVEFARRHRLAVAMRGQAHSVFGQAQAEAGVVIDSRTLAEIHELGPDGAVVDAGVTWRELVLAAAEVGLTPPVLTDYIDLSIGGVLSVGGIGGATHRSGFVADSALELTVVTGRGDVVQCSATRERELFHAVLGGLGQCGIIVKARVALVPMKPLARVYQLTYMDLSTFLRDQRAVCNEQRFDFLQGLASPLPSGGGFAYVMQAAVWYDPSSPPDDEAALVGLSPAASEILDLPYVAWQSRVDQFVAQWKAAEVWTAPHPWSDLFLPDDGVEAFVSQALSELRPEDVGPGVVLLYPFRKAPLKQPLIRVPNGDTLWLFDILRFVTPATTVEAQLANNRTLYDRAVAIGGKRYPISAVELHEQDYPVHYGPLWWPFFIAKLRWDPFRLLAPGQGIFPR